jgi:hypothetical protein
MFAGSIEHGGGVRKAQENRGFEVSGTYQYLRFNPGNGADGINCHGGSGSGGAYLTSRLGIIGEFGACKTTGLPSGVSAHQLNYSSGPDVFPDQPRTGVSIRAGAVWRLAGLHVD